MEERIQTGDVRRLKSGGPTMTFVEDGIHRNTTPNGGEIAERMFHGIYFSDGGFRRFPAEETAHFSEAMLLKITMPA